MSVNYPFGTSVVTKDLEAWRQADKRFETRLAKSSPSLHGVLMGDPPGTSVKIDRVPGVLIGSLV